MGTSNNSSVEKNLKKYLEKFFEIADINQSVEVDVGKEEVYVNLRGTNYLFTSIDDDTVPAFAHLIESILNHKFKFDGHVCLDINGRKRRQRNNLKKFSLQAARKAKRESKRIRLNPMPPAKRKWIHMTISKEDGVRTYSVGQGADRRVIIEPTGMEEDKNSR